MNRRDFIKSGLAVAAVATMPKILQASEGKKMKNIGFDRKPA